MNGPLPSSDGSGRDADGAPAVVPLWQAPLAGRGARAEARPDTKSDRRGFLAPR